MNDTKKYSNWIVKIKNWRFLNQNEEKNILLCAGHLQNGKIQEKTGVGKLRNLLKGQ